MRRHRRASTIPLEGWAMKRRLRIPVVIVVAMLAVLAVSHETASGKVFIDHERVTVTLVGGISAEPCSDPRGCVRGIVELRWKTFHALHHIRCLRPQALHVVSARKHHKAVVFACRRLYRWRLP
jgi:hypothetical protein